ncbi:MAG: hypothetical protein ACPGOV_15030 [Magnetovibrionaceae bacterium]
MTADPPLQLLPGIAELYRRQYDDEMGWTRFHQFCQGQFKRQSDVRQSTLKPVGATVQGCLSPERCRDLCEKLDQDDPLLEDRDFFLEVFGEIATPEIDGFLLGGFGSEYVPFWWHFTRDDPDGDPCASFFWHCDGGPTGHIKMLTYLNSTEESGASTLWLDRDTTRNFNELGYSFCDTSQRLADLKPLCDQYGLSHSPKETRLERGQSLLFYPMQLLHRGRQPTRAPRYMIQICLIPSPAHWRISSEKTPLPTMDTTWRSPI